MLAGSRSVRYDIGTFGVHQILEDGIQIAGIELPRMLGFSGLAMGAVIVLGMTIRPKGMFPRLEADEI
jgi:branched-chain amino acid transport system permease protein